MSDSTTKTYTRDSAHSVVVPSSRVIRSSEVAHIGGRAAVHGESAGIELVVEDNIVRAIDITCSCGKKSRLWCSYDESNINSKAETVST